MSSYLPEMWPLLAMVGIFVVGTFALKLPVSISLVAASVVGAVVGGVGFPLRHLVEGALGYLDTLLIIATAMVFMRMIQASGLLDTVAHGMITQFHHRPATLLVLMMLFAMSGGMITGSSTAAVLTTGAIVAPVFMALGIARNKTGAIIAMAGILGMIAPPVNIPVMGILVGVGMFLQIMALTGGRGFIVSMLVGLPLALLYLSIGVSMPLFGAVSAYGSASILGVPFVLALLGSNEILVASALSMIAAMGDLMPPTALAGLFAAEVVEQPNYVKVLKHCLAPAGLIILASLGFIATARFWDRFLFWDNRLGVYGILAGTVILVCGLVFLLDWAGPKRETAVVA